MKVLVIDGSSGQSHAAVSAVRALAGAGHAVHVAVEDSLSTAGWSRHCRRRIPVPPADQPEFAEAVRDLMDTEAYAAVFPATDAALRKLAWPGAELVDKRYLNALARDAHVATPEQWAFENGDSALAGAEALRWPVVVKQEAQTVHVAQPVFRADGQADLRALAGFPDPVVVEEWLTGEQRSMSGVMWGGRLRAVVHQRYVRTWPRECGVAAFAVTTGPDRQLEEELAEMLNGYNGLFQCQQLDGRLHDVNPRVYGSISLAVRAGLNLPDLVCRLSHGEPVGSSEPMRARSGVRYRWVEGDLRHCQQARKAGELTVGAALGAFRPQRGTAHPDVWLSDPGPSVARLAYGVRNRRPDR